MFVQMPKPYPDEILHSVIGRLLVYRRKKNISELFDNYVRLKAELPRHIDRIAEATQPTWGLSAEQIIDQLTLYPFYAQYAPEERKLRCLEIMRSDKRGNAHVVLGAEPSLIVRPEYFRYCPTCVSIDLQVYGETYWRRLHQVNGVRICLEHNELLIDSKIRLGLSHHGALRCDATQAIMAPTRNRTLTLSDRDRQTLRLIAQRCSDLLVNEETEWRGADLPNVYRSAALERGLGNIGTDLSARAVEGAIARFYSVKVLKLIGCGAEGIRAFNWWRKLFGVGATYRASIHPLQHVLMQVLLEHTDKVAAVSVPRSLGPWKCPNLFAAHTTPYPAHQYSAGVRRIGTFTIWAKCECGYDFSFRSTSGTDPMMPIPVRVSSRGSSWVTHAQNLRRDGLRIKDIAKQMCCTPKAVGRALRESNGDLVLQTDVALWRGQWQNLYHSGLVKSSQIAKFRNPSLYHKLSIYDHSWLMEFQKRERFNRHKEGVNWLVRDKEWAQALQTVFKRLAVEQSIKPVRLRDVWILAGIPPASTTNRLHMIPTCAALLRRHGF